ncbi:Alcohol dehydrogenase 1 [Fukomys damarensis]|uniref:Alcohol dehydrogenase 1 n=1 Tax=Fukomys damarensis TaxID=885580 RepID=A0A091DA97_FUKDA|nr:Alcohol dehydrogenase 1 [Fukomys damarensis]
MLDGTSRFTCRGETIYHSFRTSTFAEYTIVPEIAVTKIDAAAPLDKVRLLSCGVPTGYGAAVNSTKVTPGSTCVDFGLGGVGLAVVMGCKDSRASRIIGVDINEKKFPPARALGVTDCLNPRNLKKPVQEVVKEMTGGGVDFAFEVIGNTDCCLEQLPSKLWCLSGYWTGSTTLSDFPSCNDVCFWKSTEGICLGDYKTRGCIPQIVTDYLQIKINIDPIITHQLPFSQIHKAFEMYHAGKT